MVSLNFPMVSEVTWYAVNVSNWNRKCIKLEQKIYQICIKLENVSNLQLFSCNAVVSLFIFPGFLKLLGVSDTWCIIASFINTVK